jgi:outer membrane protein TolC
MAGSGAPRARMEGFDRAPRGDAVEARRRTSRPLVVLLAVLLAAGHASAAEDLFAAVVRGPSPPADLGGDAAGGGAGLGDLGASLDDDLGVGFDDLPDLDPGGLEDLGDLDGDDFLDLAPDPLPRLDGGSRRERPTGVLPVRPRKPSGPILTLSQMSGEAIAEAGALKRTRAGVAAARRGIQVADAGRWPQVHLKAEGRESNHRDRIGKLLGPDIASDLERPLSQIRNDSAFVGGFDVTTALYRGGLMNAREEEARALADVAHIRHLQSVEAVLREVGDQYLRVLLLETALELEAARLLAELQREEEAVSDADTTYLRDAVALEHELRAARIRSRKASLETRLELARARLSALRGHEAGRSFRLSRRLEVRPAAGSADELAELARKGNLEVRRRMAEAQAARRRIQAEGSRQHPDVDLDWRYRHSSPNDTDGLETDWWEAVVRLDYPLFDGGRTRARKRRAGHLSDAADVAVREAARAAGDRARSAFTREARLDATLQPAQRLVELAARHHRAVRDRVDRGGATPSDVATARVALLASQLEAFRVQAEVVRTRILQHALAGQLTLDQL